MNATQKLILVVEDDDGSRQLIKELLSFQSYQVVEAESGHRALKALEEHPIDLILMDISLPDMSGLAVMKQIRAQEEYTNLPIIALTAFVRRVDAEAAIKAGATSHIPKPVQIQELLSEIQKNLQGPSY
jgi:CheY-like chemotaxis protein